MLYLDSPMLIRGVSVFRDYDNSPDRAPGRRHSVDTGHLRNEIEIASMRRPTGSVDHRGRGRLDAAHFPRV